MKKRIILSLSIVIVFLSCGVCFSSGAIPHQQKSQNPSRQEAVQQGHSPQSSPIQQIQPRDLPKNIGYEEIEVDLGQVWNELAINSEIWSQIVDQQPKVMILDKYKEWYADQGIYIKKDSSHYAEIIDSMAQTDSDLLKVPFKDVMKFMAIIEYDYDNGQDKDSLARKILGEKRYQENRERLGL